MSTQSVPDGDGDATGRAGIADDVRREHNNDRSKQQRGPAIDTPARLDRMNFLERGFR